MNIIYIEDDLANQQVLRDMLATAGAGLTVASDAATGVAMVEAERFDLVVMDLRLPGINGLTAIRQLRARVPNGRHVPILVVSAELSAGVRDLCREAGADGFLEKPIRMGQLFDTMGELLADGDVALA